MSLEDAAAQIGIDMAMAAVHEILDRELRPEQKAAALDVIAERAAFDARGQKQQDERNRQKKGLP